MEFSIAENSNSTSRSSSFAAAELLRDGRAPPLSVSLSRYLSLKFTLPKSKPKYLSSIADAKPDADQSTKNKISKVRNGSEISTIPPSSSCGRGGGGERIGTTVVKFSVVAPSYDRSMVLKSRADFLSRRRFTLTAEDGILPVYAAGSLYWLGDKARVTVAF